MLVRAVSALDHGRGEEETDKVLSTLLLVAP
jgi:hypothetical protein